MKGIIFQEFVSMVETAFSLEVADSMLTSSNLETGGAYTCVGTYEFRELAEMVQHLSKATGIASPVLLRTFGEFLFRRFAMRYPDHIKNVTSTYALLSVLDNKVHVDVKKLYPDAELPTFETVDFDLDSNPSEMILRYRSSRPLADLAQGMLNGAIKHFGESISVTRKDFPCLEGANTWFTLKKLTHDHAG